jgi:hypothetical protein
MRVSEATRAYSPFYSLGTEGSLLKITPDLTLWLASVTSDLTFRYTSDLT